MVADADHRLIFAGWIAHAAFEHGIGAIYLYFVLNRVSGWERILNAEGTDLSAMDVSRFITTSCHSANRPRAHGLDRGAGLSPKAISPLPCFQVQDMPALEEIMPLSPGGIANRRRTGASWAVRLRNNQFLLSLFE